MCNLPVALRVTVVAVSGDRDDVAMILLGVGVVLALILGACSGGDQGADRPTTTPTSPTAATPGHEFDQALHDELVQMLADDQHERTELAPEQWNDVERAERLDEILDEHGWPAFDLVGEDGEDAAWAIAQHADHDVELQRRALDLLRDAVAAGQGSPGNLAYLTDRVALNSGESQTYGTQAGCDGPTAAPAPLEDPDGVDERRAEVGLPPLAEYLDEIEEFCVVE